LVLLLLVSLSPPARACTRSMPRIGEVALPSATSGRYLVLRHDGSAVLAEAEQPLRVRLHAEWFRPLPWWGPFARPATPVLRPPPHHRVVSRRPARDPRPIQPARHFTPSRVAVCGSSGYLVGGAWSVTRYDERHAPVHEAPVPHPGGRPIPLACPGDDARVEDLWAADDCSAFVFRARYPGWEAPPGPLLLVEGDSEPRPVSGLEVLDLFLNPQAPPEVLLAALATADQQALRAVAGDASSSPERRMLAMLALDEPDEDWVEAQLRRWLEEHPGDVWCWREGYSSDVRACGWTMLPTALLFERRPAAAVQLAEEQIRSGETLRIDVALATLQTLGREEAKERLSPLARSLLDQRAVERRLERTGEPVHPLRGVSLLDLSRAERRRRELEARLWHAPHRRLPRFREHVRAVRARLGAVGR